MSGVTLQEDLSSVAGAACITAGRYKTEITILIPFLYELIGYIFQILR